MRAIMTMTLRIGRRQRKNINARVAEGSEFAAIAGQIGGTSLFGHRWPRARCSSDFKKGAASNLPLAAKSLGTGMQARIMLVGLGDCLKGSSAALGSLNVRAPDHTARGLRC
jgi:hypothetical protein